MKCLLAFFCIVLNIGAQAGTDSTMQRVPTALATGQTEMPVVAKEADAPRPTLAPLVQPKPVAAAAPSPSLATAARLPTYSAAQTEAQRVTYLQRLVKAVRSLPESERKRLTRESEAVFGGVCHSSDPTLALSCSFQSAARICSSSPNQGACLVMIDALVVERLNANRFVSARERYEMMARGDDHRQRMAEALSYRYGSLVAAFSLSKAAACKASDLGCFAQGIDSYCQAEAQKGHLSYQSCAALIALFIASHD